MCPTIFLCQFRRLFLNYNLCPRETFLTWNARYNGSKFCWIYCTYLSRKGPIKMFGKGRVIRTNPKGGWMSLLSITFKMEQSDFLLLVELVSNSSKFPTNARGQRSCTAAMFTLVSSTAVRFTAVPFYSSSSCRHFKGIFKLSSHVWERWELKS